MKLMMLVVKLTDLVVSDDTCTLKTYHHCIAQVICNPALPTCNLGTCKACPGIDTLKTSLVALLEDNMIDNVTYRQWEAVDRSSLETVTKTSDEFVEVEGTDSTLFHCNTTSLFLQLTKI